MFDPVRYSTGLSSMINTTFIFGLHKYIFMTSDEIIEIIQIMKSIHSLSRSDVNDEAYLILRVLENLIAIFNLPYELLHTKIKVKYQGREINTTLIDLLSDNLSFDDENGKEGNYRNYADKLRTVVENLTVVKQKLIEYQSKIKIEIDDTRNKIEELRTALTNAMIKI